MFIYIVLRYFAKAFLTHTFFNQMYVTTINLSLFFKKRDKSQDSMYCTCLIMTDHTVFWWKKWKVLCASKGCPDQVVSQRKRENDFKLNQRHLAEILGCFWHLCRWRTLKYRFSLQGGRLRKWSTGLCKKNLTTCWREQCAMWHPVLQAWRGKRSNVPY